MGSLIRIISVLLFTSIGVQAQRVDSRVFWEPELLSEQSFLTLWRSIKAFAISKYDVHQEGEFYPVTELKVELTHGSVVFVYVGASRAKNKPLTLEEIAEGKFAEGNRLERLVPGKEPPKALVIRSADPFRQVRFNLPTEDAVHALYRELRERFPKTYPW